MTEEENPFRRALQGLGVIEEYADQPPEPLTPLDLLQRLHSPPLNSNDWVFRGQNYPWHLRPSIERIIEPRRLRSVENTLLKEFMSRVHQYTRDPPNEDDELSCLALMQHHGAPTRLLDWSLSPFVAAFFAVERPPREDPPQPPVIWAVNRRRLVEDIQRVVRFEDPSVPPDQVAKAKELLRMMPPAPDPFQPLEITLLKRRSPSQRPVVVPAQPSRMSERLSVQQGVFLRVNPTGWLLEDALRYVLAKQGDASCRALHKLQVNPNGRLQLINELQRMNITAESLFPGLDGFARSLMTRAEILGAR